MMFILHYAFSCFALLGEDYRAMAILLFWSENSQLFYILWSQYISNMHYTPIASIQKQKQNWDWIRVIGQETLSCVWNYTECDLIESEKEKKVTRNYEKVNNKPEIDTISLGVHNVQ